MPTHHPFLSVLSCSILASTGLIGVTAAAETAGKAPFAGFEPPVLYPVDFLPASIHAGDLDGDGDNDIITANSGVPSSNLSLLFNNGDGTFAPDVRIPIANATTDVAIADLDGDGVVDLAATFGGTSPITGTPIGGLALLKGLGGGAFGEPQFFNAGVQPISIGAGDLTGDGAPDLILVNQLSNNISVFINRGDGTFDAPIFYTVGNRPQRVTIADMDADGDLDAVVVNIFSDDLYVFINDGSGSLATLRPVATPFGGNRSLPVADLNGDGLSDVVVSTGTLGLISVHFNLGGGILAPAMTIKVAEGFGTASAVVAPFDKDRGNDIAVDVIEPFVPNSPSFENVFINTGNECFAPVDRLFPLGINQSVIAQCASDFDHDGDIDIAVSFGNVVSVLLNKTNTPTAADLTHDGVVDGADLATLLQAWGSAGAGDLNGDGVVNGADLASLLVNWTNPAKGSPKHVSRRKE